MEEDRRHIGSNAKRTALLQLGRRLRQARHNSHLTQVQVAQDLATSAQTVRNWEAGRHEPTGGAIKLLADLYHVSEKRFTEGLDTVIVPARGFRFRYNRVIVEPEKLAVARQDSMLTQAQVAELTGLSLSAIRRYEKGWANPETTTLETLASIYNRPAEWFTPRGYFTDDERHAFTESVTPGAANSPEGDMVNQVYNQTRAFLSDDARMRIAKFIKFTYDQELRNLQPMPWRRN